MPRTKTTRNPLGSIFPRKLKRGGKTVTVNDARKRYRNADGKVCEKFQRCNSYEEAMLALVRFKTEIENELNGQIKEREEAPAEHRLHELIEVFRAEYVVPVQYANGEKIVGYKSPLPHINSVLDSIKDYFSDDPELSKITFDRLKAYKRYLQITPTRFDKPPAVSTVNEKLAFLNRVLTVGFEKEWLVINPFKKGKGLINQTRRKKRNRPMTFAEEVALYKVCQPHDQIIPVERDIQGTLSKYTQTFHIDRRNLWNLVICSVDAGLRVGEIFDLRWWQLDLQNRVIYLTDDAAERTKTGEPGIIPMTTRLVELFTSINDGQDRDANVFIRFDYKTSWKNAMKEAEIAGLQFRDLRGTASTRMLLAGNSGPQVRKVTRHRTDKVFQDHYVSVDVINAQRIGASMDLFLAKELEKASRKENAKENGGISSMANAA